MTTFGTLAARGWSWGVGDADRGMRYGGAARTEVRDMEVAEEAALLSAGLVGDASALRRLVVWLTPVIQVRCARALVGTAGAARRDLREEVEDMAQEVFTTLFEHDARVLRAWDPSRGLTLRGFVGLVARRKVNGILAVRKRNPWYEEPMEAEAVERALADVAETERRLASHQVLQVALARTDEGLSERGRELLSWLIRDGLTVEEIKERSGLNEAAIYQWRSRLTKAVRGHVEALLAEGDGRPGGEA